jgi:nicotinate-nucleotide--dimethylbenzimidazole phosphoribosyltransferase
MDDVIRPLLSDLPGPHSAAAAAVLERADRALRPAGALEQLDHLAAWLAGWQRSAHPAVNAPVAVLFVADHGVAARGVSAYPQSVTAAMLGALRAGAATSSVMARSVGARLAVVDVGVGRPTADLTTEPALSRECFMDCFQRGRDAVSSLDADVVALGEMGIGNTTSAAAVCAALFGVAAQDAGRAGPDRLEDAGRAGPDRLEDAGRAGPDRLEDAGRAGPDRLEDAGRARPDRLVNWVGRGTGVDDRAYARKVAAVEAATARVRPSSGPFEVLRQLGGAELAAAAGAVLEARRRSIPVVLDGFVVGAAVAPLELSRPGALDHCLAGHCSSEPGHRMLLDELGKSPLLDLGLRLGEASGALAALPLLRLAAATATKVATFEEWSLAGPR